MSPSASPMESLRWSCDSNMHCHAVCLCLCDFLKATGNSGKTHIIEHSTLAVFSGTAETRKHHSRDLRYSLKFQYLDMDTDYMAYCKLLRGRWNALQPLLRNFRRARVCFGNPTKVRINKHPR